MSQQGRIICSILRFHSKTPEDEREWKKSASESTCKRKQNWLTGSLDQGLSVDSEADRYKFSVKRTSFTLAAKEQEQLYMDCSYREQNTESTLKYRQYVKTKINLRISHFCNCTHNIPTIKDVLNVLLLE